MPRKTYADYNEPGEAHSFEEQHFSGVFGTYLKRSDENALADLLPDRTGSVLDVGAGSGRISIYLAGSRSGTVVASDASIAMLTTAASRSSDAAHLQFVLADAQYLPFADKSFDYVVSFRTLMHLKDWTGAVAEMCRVTRKAVVIDVPARLGAPGLEAMFHSVLHMLGSKTRPYRTFNRREVRRTFKKIGFVVDHSRKNFVLPVKVSRLLNNSRLPVAIESFFQNIGVSRVLGGQLVIRAVRG